MSAGRNCIHALGGYLAAAVTLCFAGCTVGDGVGKAEGALYVKGCSKKDPDWGHADMPTYYNLQPEFFVGEPIEDIKKDGTRNRIVIRLQDSGKSIEADDFLQFDIVNSYQVARCLRGKMLDERTALFCYWPPGQAWPRIRIGPNLPIRSALALRETCPLATLVGTGRDGDGARSDVVVPLPPEQWRSWIDLSEFGSARNHDVSPNFRVEFNERLKAESFHVDLLDDRVIEAERLREPLPDPEFLGHIDGNFDFELERGQGAQTFP